jgi:TetR/AcrR family transcriptional repressor of nem operon
MRYTSDRKAETRQRVLEAAARHVRERGPHNIALALVMAEVGLTHGGFYAHFKSKREFLTHVVDQMFVVSPSAILEGDPARSPLLILSDFIDYYLSPEHRDTRDAGCPLPFLVSESTRLSPEVNRRVSCGFLRMSELVASHLRAVGATQPDELAVSCISEIVGALIIARADRDTPRSDILLARTRVSVRTRMGLEIMN